MCGDERGHGRFEDRNLVSREDDGESRKLRKV
jgi:hypothetical protein